MVYVAQLVRVPDCDSGSRGFEPHHTPNMGSAASEICHHNTLAWGSGVAIVSSNLTTPPKRYLRIARVGNRLILYVGGDVQASNERGIANIAQMVEQLICIQQVISSILIIGSKALVAQLVEHQTFNLGVGGSYPPGRTIKIF